LASLPPRKWSEEFLAKVEEEGKKDEAYQKAKKEAALEEPSLKDRKVKEGIQQLREGLLYRGNLLWALEGIVLQILESEHDTKVEGHTGEDETIELVQRNFWWPKMNKRIIDFIGSCPECQKNKAVWHRTFSQSSPLELPYAPW